LNQRDRHASQSDLESLIESLEHRETQAVRSGFSPIIVAGGEADLLQRQVFFRQRIDLGGCALVSLLDGQHLG
jgi:hypothetical protein